MKLLLSKGIPLFAFISLFTIQLSAQILPTFSDVDYVGDGITRHLLDVYVPPTFHDTPRPAVMYIHGGGWENGKKKGELRSDLTPLYQLAKYIIIDINYRYSSDSIWPAQLYDCKAAIRHLRHHAALYNIDTCAIGVMGHSAGGHLAAVLGTTNHIDSLEGYHLGYPDQHSKVHAVIDFFGPTDFLQADEHFPVAPPDSCLETVIYADAQSIASQLVGCPITTCPKKVKSANPITYINGNEPPFRIYHGTFDCAVPLHQSQILYESLVLQNISTDFIIVENAVHADNIFYTPSAVTDLSNFFVEHLSAVTCYPISTAADSIFKNNFNIFPNPASDFIFLDIEGNSTLPSIEILDYNGKIIRTYNDTKIDIQGLPKGVYLIHIRFHNENIFKKLIKM